MTKIYSLTIILILLVINSCSSTQKTRETRPEPALKLYGGFQQGGIIENTDFSTIGDISPDAFTGATNTGFHTGIHYEYFTRALSFETGLDAIANKQSFRYSDMTNNHLGERKLLTTQLRVPLTINFRLAKGNKPEGIVKFKLGISPGISMINQLSSQGFLPDYSTGVFTLGPAMAIELSPFKINNTYNPGIYFGLFRSAQAVYYDFYQVGEMPGLSYMTFGITWNLTK
ncbi:MAG: hypothetical protein ACOCWA_03920 [Bacteroidota bacterium]